MSKPIIPRLGLLLSLVSLGATADTQYVSDVMRIMLRVQPSENAKLIRTLPSGTPLELKGVSSGDFTKVTDPDGDTGWVLTRFLMDTPAAQAILPGVQKDLENCEQQRDSATEGLKSCESSSGSRIGKLQTRNQELEAALTESRREVAELQSAQDQQSGREMRDWFITGAGVLAGGVVLGMIISAMLKRRRPSAWS